MNSTFKRLVVLEEMVKFHTQFCFIKCSTKSQRICKSMALMRVHAGELYYFKLSSFITVTVIQIIIVVAVMYASLYANVLNVLSFNF